MNEVQKVGEAETSPFALPCSALLGYAQPGRAMLGFAVPHPYERKLQKVLEAMGSLYTIQDILTALHAGKMQMLAENDSIAVTQICCFPRAKVLEILAVVGDLEDLRILHDRVLNFAEKIGAGVIQAYGRRGWFADAKQRGWKVKARSFVYQREM